MVLLTLQATCSWHFLCGLEAFLNVVYDKRFLQNTIITCKRVLIIIALTMKRREGKRIMLQKKGRMDTNIL